MTIRVTAALAAVLMLGACSAKNSTKQPSEDPFAAARGVEVAKANTDTLTYDFLAETSAAPEASSRYVPDQADLPELSDMEVAAIEPKVPPTTAKPRLDPPVRQATQAPSDAEGHLFWVQIFASSNRKSAEEFALEADGRLEERVRILFLEPYYKVLVGGYADREKAVDLRRDLTSVGYEGAWIFEK